MLKLQIKRAWTNYIDFSGLVAKVCGHPNDGNVLIRSVTATSDKQL